MSSSQLAMKFLSQMDMIAAGVTDMDKCIEVMSEVFILAGKGDYVMGGSTRNSHGQRIWFPPEPKFDGMPKGGPDQRFMALPGYLGGRFRVCGNKWYGSNVHNPAKHGLPRSILLMTLNDAETARPLAIMEANILSGMRTGAVVGLSAKYLARDDSETLGVIAAGPISKFSATAIIKALPSLKKVVVYDINEEAAKRFCTEIGEQLDIDVSVVNRFEDAVRGQDVITSAISGDHTPLFEDKWLKEGSLLTLPGRANVEEDYLRHAYIVPDCWEMQKTYKIEGMMLPKEERTIPHLQLHNMIDRGEIKESDIHDLGKIAAGIASIEKNSNKKRYFISNGTILQDIGWGMTMYESALQKGLGQDLVLWEKPYRI
ncbi:tyramine oxidase subunit B [Desulforhopalus singaporensis]|uniref:Ornithine cyclodeaminase n=1 Tax=Desulforhopalus singaporensis TaxID=91360 RepID=A0A1H0JX98_9BACT|nr:tyramine oxidase subunit B [Desulforhopalus singaporensis]SDO48011.1 ornithine cyclodeaminase [Desulforhopalus singaporensis]